MKLNQPLCVAWLAFCLAALPTYADGLVPANTPPVEALHVDVHGSRGLTFITRAQPIALGKRPPLIWNVVEFG